MEKLAFNFRPKMIIIGASAYPRDWDYDRVRKICDKVGAMLMADIAHISGMVATGELKSPFELCDIVTTTTHKSLRGPRSGMIFFRRGPKSDEEGAPKYEYEDAINFAVFPSLQGGPHNHQIAGLCTQLKEVATPEFKVYQKQTKANAATLAKYLMAKDYKLATDGTGAPPPPARLRALARSRLRARPPAPPAEQAPPATDSPLCPRRTLHPPLAAVASAASQRTTCCCGTCGRSA